MPQFRDYRQATSLLATDAFVIDRVGLGTYYVDYSVITSSGYSLTVEQAGTIIDAAVAFVFGSAPVFPAYGQMLLCAIWRLEPRWEPSWACPTH